MKLSLLFLVALLPLNAAEDQPPLRKGDDVSRISEVLGPATRSVQASKSGVHYYERGEVHFRNGVVTHIFLISQKEVDQRNQLAEEVRVARKAEGEARLAIILEEKTYSSLPGTEQVKFWDSFREKFPEVDIQIPYMESLFLAKSEEAAQEKEDRLAILEQRVMEAEVRAAQATEAAARTQQLAATQQERVRVVYPALGYSALGYRPLRYSTNGRRNPYAFTHIPSAYSTHRNAVLRGYASGYGSNSILSLEVPAIHVRVK